MKDYTKPTLQIFDSLSEKYCAVVLDAVSGTEVNDRLLFETEDEFTD